MYENNMHQEEINKLKEKVEILKEALDVAFDRIEMLEIAMGEAQRNIRHLAISKKDD